jgi:hypothetical protein
MVRFQAVQAEVRRAEEAAADGRYADALEIYRHVAVELVTSPAREVGPPRDAELQVFHRLAEISRILGFTQAAEELLAGVQLARREAGDVASAAWIGLQRAALALDEGDVRLARDLLEGVLGPLSEIDLAEFRPDRSDEWWLGVRGLRSQEAAGFADWALARLCAVQGQYGLASMVRERGLRRIEGAETDPARWIAASLQLLRIEILVEIGALNEARAALEEIATAVASKAMSAHQAQYLELKGRVTTLQGNFGEALRCHEEIAELCSGAGLFVASLSASVNLAQSLALVNQTARARKIAAHVMTVAGGLGADRAMQRATIVMKLAEERRSSGTGEVVATPSVHTLLRPRSHDPRDESGSRSVKWDAPDLDLRGASSFLARLEDRELRIRWLLSVNPGAAVQEVADLDAIFGHTDSPMIHARLDAIHGLVDYYSGAYGRAETRLVSAARIQSQLELKPELWQTRRVLGWCWARLGRSAEDRRRLAQDNEETLRNLARSLHGGERAMYLLNKWTLEEEGLSLRIRQLEATRDRRRAKRPGVARLVLRWRETRSVIGLLQQLEEKQRMLASRFLGDDEMPVNKPTEGGALRSLLRPCRGLTLSYLSLPDSVVVIRKAFCQVDFAVLPVTRIALREAVAQLHRSMAHRSKILRELHDEENSSPGDPDPARADEILEELSRSLALDEVLGEPPGRCRPLRLVLDDALHGVPFAPLRYRGGPLLDHFAPSTSLYSGARARERRRGRSATDALLIGVSRPVPGRRSSALPEVPVELDRVGAHLSRSRAVDRIEDGQATRQRLLGRLEQTGFWHAACHGTFEPDDPDRTGLVLVPGDGSASEILSIRDLAELDLTKMRHATLSSCWAADSYVLPGRWVIGLSEALCRAGVESVLSSVWPVDDRVSVLFMDRFYRHLRSMRRDRALRTAQLECIANELGAGIPTSDPVYWAGYRLMGEGGRLGVGLPIKSQSVGQ